MKPAKACLKAFILRTDVKQTEFLNPNLHMHTLVNNKSKQLFRLGCKFYSDPQYQYSIPTCMPTETVCACGSLHTKQVLIFTLVVMLACRYM